MVHSFVVLLSLLSCFFFTNLGTNLAPVSALASDQPPEPLVESSDEIPQASENGAISNYKSDHAHLLDVTADKLLGYIKDPENRINLLFKVPDSIRPMVAFWFLIYVKFSLYQTLIYDKDNPSIIYDVVDNNDLFQKGKGAIAIEIMGKQRLQKSLTEIKTALEKLARNPNTKFSPHSMGQKIIHLCGKLNSKQWRQRLENLRTQAGQRDRVLEGIRASEPFIPPMELIFMKFRMPTELTRIPLLESSFNLNAVSKADAVGVWQFLERSAKEYLVVNKEHGIDERLSPVKAAYAAAKMFKRNYKILGDYALAIIAYNHGIRNLISIKDKFKGSNITKLLNMKENTPLGYASRNYYAEFLAILHAEKYKDHLYGIELKKYPSSISIIKIKKSQSIFELSSHYNVPLLDLKKYNPDIFDSDHKLPVGTKVVLPKEITDSIVFFPDPKKDYDRLPANVE